MPRSLSTGKLYRGVNVWLLGSSMYASPWWGTFTHIADRGGRVRKGERSTLVVFWKKTARMAAIVQEARRSRPAWTLITGGLSGRFPAA